MIRAFGVAVFLLISPAGAMADAGLARLFDLLALENYLRITRAEGMADAEEISQDMLGRAADAVFLDQLSRIYDVERMRATVMEHLSGMDAADIEKSIAYFQTDAALRITELEVAARRAMMDADVEQSARQSWIEAQDDRPEAVARIEQMSEINDLVERNVSGALNSNLRYYQGLADGGGIELTEEEILALVWAQESDIRAETEAWLGGYYLLAYDPLAASDLEDYLAFWKSPAGQALNTAIFGGFNRVYDDVSYATGRILALNMMSQEL